MNRYETVLKWLKEYGLEIVETNDSSAYWHETKVKNFNGTIMTFEITNNHIWHIKDDRKSLGKTKTELYMNLDKMCKRRISNI